MTPFRRYEKYSNQALGPVLIDHKSVPTGSSTSARTFLWFVITEPSRMLHILSKECHEGYSQEFVGTENCACRQAKAASGRIWAWTIQYYITSMAYECSIVKVQYQSATSVQDTNHNKSMSGNPLIKYSIMPQFPGAQPNLANIILARGIDGCHNDNLRRYQWWQNSLSCYHDTNFSDSKIYVL